MPGSLKICTYYFLALAFVLQINRYNRLQKWWQLWRNFLKLLKKQTDVGLWWYIFFRPFIFMFCFMLTSHLHSRYVQKWNGFSWKWFFYSKVSSSGNLKIQCSSFRHIFPILRKLSLKYNVFIHFLHKNVCCYGVCPYRTLHLFLIETEWP